MMKNRSYLPRSRINPARRTRGAGVAIALALAAALVSVTPGVVAEPFEDDPGAAARDPDYAAGKAAMDKKNWREALKRFNQAARRAPDSADLQNYIGFCHRNLGQLDLAFRHYGRALELNPRHRGAHEYVGEAYLMVNNLAKAQEHLAALEKICLLPCEELDDLRGKIAAYRKKHGS
jgi:tetratricopeptide (TPR) repeat protein